jgi:hypothetical protein
MTRSVAPTGGDLPARAGKLSHGTVLKIIAGRRAAA